MNLKRSKKGHSREGVIRGISNVGLIRCCPSRDSSRHWCSSIMRPPTRPPGDFSKPHLQSTFISNFLLVSSYFWTLSSLRRQSCTNSSLANCENKTSSNQYKWEVQTKTAFILNFFAQIKLSIVYSHNRRPYFLKKYAFSRVFSSAKQTVNDNWVENIIFVFEYLHCEAFN